MGSVFFDILNAGDVASAFNIIVEKLTSAAAIIKLPTIAMFVFGAVLAALIGIFGYKYIKLVSTICFAAAGYGIGAGLFGLLKESYGWKIPDLVGIFVGIAILVLLGFLAYKKFAYALFGVACFMGFVLAYFVYPNYVVAIAVAIVIAMLSMYFVRYAFVFFTSSFAGFALVAMFSGMLPRAPLFDLYGSIGKVLAIILVVIFAAIQLRMSRKEAKKYGQRGVRRVKIRRVFDAW